MASSSSLLTSGNEPTAVLRVGSSLHVAVTMDDLPPRLPTLSTQIVPLGSPPATVQVPGYEIHRELGRGGMGVVYLARHRKLDRYVALKMVLARQYAGPEDQQRFRQEVEAVAKLNHPHIAQVYEVGEHDGFAFAAFEYVDGGTLLQWQSDQPVASHDAARLIATIARAVQHAHDHGIVHRDLKPANILLSHIEEKTRGNEAGTHSAIQPKITDFGLAKKLDQHSDLTATGMACGTPNYMAPEQIRGKHAIVGPATDVYGLGAILFELLTAKPPYRGETPLSTMQKVLNDPPPALRRLRADVPHDLEVITAKCLEKDPARRYASAAALADDLDRFLDYRPIQARGVGRFERGGRWIRRNPLATGLMASLAFGFISMIAFSAVLWNRVQAERNLRGELENAIVTSEEAQNRAMENRALAELKQKDAEFAKSEAERARKEAEETSRRADEARKEAETSAERVSSMLDLATVSIDMVLAKFVMDPRFQDEDFLVVRQDLLRSAKVLYARLKDQSANQSIYLYRSVRAQYFLGLLARSSGKVDEGNAEIRTAIGTFRKLLEDRPGAAQWRCEFAGMCLEEIDRAREDGSVAQVNLLGYLDYAKQALDHAEKNPRDLMEPALLPLTRARWLVQRAWVAGIVTPKEQARLAAAAEPLVDQLFRDRPREAEVVDLYGRLLLIQAHAAARENQPIADCYFEAADNHYQRAVQEWFPSPRMTRWHCRYALARYAHGTYLDSLGLYDRSDEALLQTRTLLENAIDSAPEIATYRMDLAEAYLGIINRMRKLQPQWDPRPMCTILDSRLAPFWNIGVPTDRARRVLAESKVLMAQWCEEQKLHILAGNTYLDITDIWMHGFKLDEGGYYRDFAAVSLSRSAFQFALARQADWVERSAAALSRWKAPPPGAWYNIARAWSELASSKPDDSEKELQNALAALRKADEAGFFQSGGNRGHFQQAPEFASVRSRYEPKNVKTAR